MEEQASNERKVVIAMDGSGHSRYAFEWYVENLQRPGDTVLIVHSSEIHNALQPQKHYFVPSAFDPSTFEHLLKQQVEENRKELQGYADLLKEYKIHGSVKGIHVKNPGEGIVKEAVDFGAALVVVGSRGKSKVRRTLIGSTSDYVMKHTNIPVVVCRNKDVLPDHHRGFHLFGRQFSYHKPHVDPKTPRKRTITV